MILTLGVHNSASVEYVEEYNRTKMPLQDASSGNICNVPRNKTEWCFCRRTSL